MATHCIPQITFRFDPSGKPVVAAFDVPYASSDGGAILLKGIDTHLGLTKRLAECFTDPREPGKVRHQHASALRILGRLQSGPATGLEFIQAGGGIRFGARILELRSAGHDIHVEPKGEGIWLYTLKVGSS